MSQTRDFDIYLETIDGDQVGIFKDFRQFKIRQIFNGVGVWSLIMSPTAFLADSVTIKSRIVLKRLGVTIASGQVQEIRKRSKNGVKTLTIKGATDEVVLLNRLVIPEPSTAAPPYSTDSHDERSGIGSTVLIEYVNFNIGLNARTPRIKAGLTVAADPVVGNAVTARGRWEPLIEFMAKIALTAGGIGFRVVDMEFQTYAPQDFTDTIIFSEEFANLVSYEYWVKWPSANYVFVAGQGKQELREIVEGGDAQSIIDYDLIEALKDRRDTPDTAELLNEKFSYLAENAFSVGVKIEPLETTGKKFGIDYTLGDKVSAVIEGERLEHVIREVFIELKPGRAKVEPILGTVDTALSQALVSLVQGEGKTSKRLNSIERE